MIIDTSLGGPYTIVGAGMTVTAAATSRLNTAARGRLAFCGVSGSSRL